ncbi:MAG: flagellar basal body L-ring protein FlgH [Bdellovibrionales bacterium]|nr:flagellar basal body L-ring protein FlgH [Bdellovibrionales bacterium]
MKKCYPLFSFLLCVSGCVPPGEMARPALPSLDYVRNLHNPDHADGQHQAGNSPQMVRAQQAIGFRSSHEPMNMSPEVQQAQYQSSQDARASFQFVADTPKENFTENGEMVSNMGAPSYEVHRSAPEMTRPYKGPLRLGEPGVTSSLWQDTSLASSLFRDHRAFQPMDLITIVVEESSKGEKKADTSTKKDSTFLAGIASFFGFENDLQNSKTGLDSSTLVDSSWESEYKGEGETTREGSLEARIAAVVVEVLPNGVMRIEGEKIIAVNNEEQIMVISGLVRPRDVTSSNEVYSSKLANLRIDFFGRGTLGDVQYAGWFGRLMKVIWPF